MLRCDDAVQALADGHLQLLAIYDQG